MKKKFIISCKDYLDITLLIEAIGNFHIKDNMTVSDLREYKDLLRFFVGDNVLLASPSIIDELVNAIKEYYND